MEVQMSKTNAMSRACEFPVLNRFTAAFYKPVDLMAHAQYACDITGHDTVDNEASLFSQLKRDETSVETKMTTCADAITTARNIRIANDAVTELIHLGSQFNKCNPSKLTGKVVGGIETTGYHRREMFICANLMEIVEEEHFFNILSTITREMLNCVKVPVAGTDRLKGIKIVIGADILVARYLDMLRQKNSVAFSNDTFGDVHFEVAGSTNCYMNGRVFATLVFPDVKDDPRPTSLGNIVYVPGEEKLTTKNNREYLVSEFRMKLVCVNPMLAEIFIKQ
jgi:hypothetical protein